MSISPPSSPKLVGQSRYGKNVPTSGWNKASFDGSSRVGRQQEQVGVGQKEYLIDFGEEATPNQLSSKVFPELQFADSGAELLPAVHMVVFVWRLTVQGGTRGLRGHVHITHPGDIR